MGPGLNDDLAADLESLLALADTDPDEAERQLPTSSDKPTVQLLSRRVLGAIALNRGEIARAVDLLQSANAEAQRHDRADIAAETIVQLAGATAQGGDTERALQLLDMAEPHLTDLWRGRAMGQRAVIHQRLGSPDAEALLNAAIDAMRAARDERHLARALSNRGVLACLAGRIDVALTDLEEAEELHRRCGNTVHAAMESHNVGYTLSRRGDFPAALSRLEIADRELHELGVDSPVVLLDRAEILLGAGLPGDAAEVANVAVDRFDQAGDAIAAAEARLVAAEAHLSNDNPIDAARLAREAHALFSHQQRPIWADRALLTAARADPSTHADDAPTLAAAQRLAAQGWSGHALDGYLAAAAAAERAHDTARAHQILVLAEPPHQDLPASLAARFAYASSRRHALEGDNAAARDALNRAFVSAAEACSLADATEMRAQAASRFYELEDAAMALALADGNDHQMLNWIEQCRRLGINVATRRAVPPDDSRLAELLDQLRAVAHRGDDHADADAIDQQVRLEREVTGLLRRQRSTQTSTSGPVFVGDPVPRVVAATRDGPTILYVVDHRELVWSLVAQHGTLTRRGPIRRAPLAAAIAQLQFSLEQWASSNKQDERTSAAQGVTEVAERARRVETLIEVLLPSAWTGETVVVPSRTTLNLPWSLLPKVTGSVSVCTSGLDVLTAPPKTPTAAAVLSGPRIGPTRELESAARPYVTAEIFTDATVDQALHAFATADIIHVAAHGTFRRDNPMFSSLHFADGALHLWELERLPRIAERLVIAACDFGLGVSAGGLGLRGASAVLNQRGCAGFIASATPLPDHDLEPTIAAVHRHIAQGSTCARALHEARAEQSGTDGNWTAHVLTAFGRG